MGKTYRHEKSYKPMKKSDRKLNNHRDLPDYPEYFDNFDDDYGYNEKVEDYRDAKTIRSKESDNLQREGRQTPKNNKG